MAFDPSQIPMWVGACVGSAVAAWSARRVSSSTKANETANAAVSETVQKALDTARAEMLAALGAHAQTMYDRIDAVAGRVDDAVGRIARVERRLSPTGVPRVDPPSEPRVPVAPPPPRRRLPSVG